MLIARDLTGMRAAGVLSWALVSHPLAEQLVISGLIADVGMARIMSQGYLSSLREVRRLACSSLPCQLAPRVHDLGDQ